MDLLQCTCSKPKNNFYILGPLVRILNVIQNPDSTKKFLAFLQSTLSKLILNWIHSSHVNRIIESILLNSARKILPPHPVSTRAILYLLLLSTRIKLSRCHHPYPVAGCGHCLEVRAEDDMINYKGHRSESEGGELCLKKRWARSKPWDFSGNTREEWAEAWDQVRPTLRRGDISSDSGPFIVLPCHSVRQCPFSTNVKDCVIMKVKFDHLRQWCNFKQYISWS